MFGLRRHFFLRGEKPHSDFTSFARLVVAIQSFRRSSVVRDRHGRDWLGAKHRSRTTKPFASFHQRELAAAECARTELNCEPLHHRR
jgi:hypothetical protein